MTKNGKCPRPHLHIFGLPCKVFLHCIEKERNIEKSWSIDVRTANGHRQKALPTKTSANSVFSVWCVHVCAFCQCLSLFVSFCLVQTNRRNLKKTTKNDKNYIPFVLCACMCFVNFCRFLSVFVVFCHFLSVLDHQTKTNKKDQYLTQN